MCMCANAGIVIAGEIKMFCFLKLLIHEVVAGVLDVHIEID